MSTVTYEHTYTTPGVYTVTVTDATGATASDTVTVVGAPLPVPGNLRTPPLGPDKLSAMWDQVPGNNGYSVRWRKLGDTAWTTVDVAKDVTLYDITGLTASTTYETQVMAKGTPPAQPDGAWSGSVQGTTLAATQLAPPTAIAAAANGTTGLTVTWTAPGGTPTGYEMRWAPTGTTTWTTVPAAASPGQITGLTAATTYDVQVRALGDGNVWLTSDWSASVQGTTAAA